MADDEDSFAFVPFLDLCQHAADPAADFASGDGAFALRARRDLEAGEELSICYGADYSSRRLFKQCARALHCVHAACTLRARCMCMCTPHTHSHAHAHEHAACARRMSTPHEHRRDSRVGGPLSPHLSPHRTRALPLPQTASCPQRAWRQTRRCSSSCAPRRRRRRRPAPTRLRGARGRRRPRRAACSLVRSRACRPPTWTRSSPPSRSTRAPTSPPPRGSPPSTTRSRPTKHRAATRVQPAA